MMSKLLHFASLLFVALALVPAGAHLMELKHKIALSGTEYLTVQQIYRGWNLAGIVVVAALLSTIGRAVALRGQKPAGDVGVRCALPPTYESI